MAPKATTSESSSAPAGGSSSNDQPNNGTRRVKGKRTRTGCLTCRARKVKCDESPGTCANYERAAAQAMVKTEITDNHSPGPIRRNRQAACVGCRIARCRCSQDRPSCARCVEHGTVCEYTAGHNTGRTPSSAEVSPNDPELDHKANLIHGIPRPIADRHVESFFSYVYPIQANAIVHRGTLMRDMADGRISRKVLLAICAAGARFLEPIKVSLTGSSAANAWAAEAKASLLTEDPSLDSITAALILAKHDINSGRFSQAFVLCAVAMRMALSMRLHLELPADDEHTVTEREIRRRLMWGCFSLDRMMSTGVREFLITPVSSLRIRLPCDDQRFLFGIDAPTPIPALESQGDSSDYDPATYEGVGILGHHLRLQGVRTMILHVSRNREPTDLLPWNAASPFVVAERKIQGWYESLSSQFRLTPETIYARKAQNELTSLVMLHVWYHQNMAELTRLAMPGFKESLEPSIAAAAPPGWLERTRDNCVQHARMIATTLRHVASLVDLDTIIFGDPSLPICVYEAVRVRLQYAFLLPIAPQAAELAELAADVEVMFAFLIKMSEHFRNAQWLLRETRRMLQRHGLDGTVHSDTSGGASPNGDPWSSRVRSLRDQQPRRPQPTLMQPPPPQLSLSMPQQGGLIPNSQAMYNERYLDWASTGTVPNEDEVVALLTEYSQSQAAFGGGGGGGGGGSFGGMFGDWVAIGYDGGPIPLVDPPLQV